MFQAITRIMMALVLAFGVQATASAQFGKLLKKAKEAVKDGVEVKIEKKDASVDATSGSTRQAASKEAVLGKIEPGEPGEVTIKERKTGKLLGTYDRAAMKMTAADGKVYLFREDGTVTDGEGTKEGSIDSDSGEWTMDNGQWTMG